jgi:hypothetical protein
MRALDHSRLNSAAAKAAITSGRSSRLAPRLTPGFFFNSQERSPEPMAEAAMKVSPFMSIGIELQQP